MNESELIAALVDRTNLPKSDASRTVEALLHTVVASGEEVQRISFKPVHLAARQD